MAGTVGTGTGGSNGPDPTDGLGGGNTLAEWMEGTKVDSRPGSTIGTNPNFNSGMFNPNFSTYNVGQQMGYAPMGYNFNTPGAGQQQHLRMGTQAFGAQPIGQGGQSGGFFNNLRSNGQGFQNLAGAAQGGTIQNFNRAANRLRERLDSQASSQTQSNVNALGARGMGNSGAALQARNNAQQSARGEFAQGLNQLEGQFEGFRQQGLQTALGALQGNQQSEALNQGLAKFIETQGQQGQQFLQELLMKGAMGASQQELQAMLAEAGIKSSEEIAENTGQASMFGNLANLFGGIVGSPFR